MRILDEFHDDPDGAVQYLLNHPDDLRELVVWAIQQPPVPTVRSGRALPALGRSWVETSDLLTLDVPIGNSGRHRPFGDLTPVEVIKIGGYIAAQGKTQVLNGENMVQIGKRAQSFGAKHMRDYWPKLAVTEKELFGRWALQAQHSRAKQLADVPLS